MHSTQEDEREKKKQQLDVCACINTQSNYLFLYIYIYIYIYIYTHTYIHKKNHIPIKIIFIVKAGSRGDTGHSSPKEDHKVQNILIIIT